MSDRIARWETLYKLRKQCYEQALREENQARQTLTNTTATLAQIKHYQEDYRHTLDRFKEESTRIDKFRRYNRFLQHLVGMEVEQSQRLDEAQSQVLSRAHESLLQRQKFHSAEELAERAKKDHIARQREDESKQMDDIARYRASRNKGW